MYALSGNTPHFLPSQKVWRWTDSRPVSRVLNDEQLAIIEFLNREINVNLTHINRHVAAADENNQKRINTSRVLPFLIAINKAIRSESNLSFSWGWCVFVTLSLSIRTNYACLSKWFVAAVNSFFKRTMWTSPPYYLLIVEWISQYVSNRQGNERDELMMIMFIFWSRCTFDLIHFIWLLLDAESALCLSLKYIVRWINQRTDQLLFFARTSARNSNELLRCSV